MTIRILTAAALLTIALPAFAVTLDLPALAGDYAYGDDPPPGSVTTRSMVFALPDTIAGFDGLRLRTAGTWNVGLIEQCRQVFDVIVCDTLPAGIHLTLHLTAPALGDGGFVASFPVFGGAGADEELFPYGGATPADIALLLAGPVTAELFCDPDPGGNQPFVAATWGTLTGVSLETVGTVPTAGSRWGTVKALYR